MSVRTWISAWWERRCAEREKNEQFKLDDFIAQMLQVRRLGPMSKTMGLMPGIRELAGKMDLGEAEKQMDRMEAIYNSMAVEEREYPEILNGSRRRRIADGAGVRTIEVNQFMRQFFMSRDMMHHVGGMGVGGKIDLMRKFMDRGRRD